MVFDVDVGAISGQCATSMQPSESTPARLTACCTWAMHSVDLGYTTFSLNNLFLSFILAGAAIAYMVMLFRVKVMHDIEEEAAAQFLINGPVDDDGTKRTGANAAPHSELISRRLYQRYMLAPHYTYAQVTAAWLFMQALLIFVPDTALYVVAHILYFTHTVIENAVVLMALSIGLSSRVVLYSAAGAIVLAIVKTIPIALINNSAGACKWCPTFTPSPEAAFGNFAFMVLYATLLTCHMVPAITQVRIRGTVLRWLVFLLAYQVLLSIGATITLLNATFGICLELIGAYLYALLAPPLLFVTLRGDSQVLAARREQQALAGDFFEEQEATISTRVAPIIQNYSLRAIPFEELTLDGMIGSGGFGEVYKGRWNNEKVAVKKLLASSRGDSFHEFMKEVDMLSKLEHPNIIRLHGVSLKKHDQYLVLEFAANGSVFDYIHHSAEERMPFTLVHKICLDCAKGMAYLHSFDPPILHRDLKSQNLLLTEEFDTKLCDFGLSRVKSISQTMSRIGTVQWVAPEVLREERYSEQADVWSFGVIIWELVARQIPYKGIPAIRVATNVAFKNWLLKKPVNTPRPLSDVMDQCWRSQNRRPSFPVLVTTFESMDMSDFTGYTDRTPRKKK